MSSMLDGSRPESAADRVAAALKVLWKIDQERDAGVALDVLERT